MRLYQVKVSIIMCCTDGFDPSGSQTFTHCVMALIDPRWSARPPENFCLAATMAQAELMSKMSNRVPIRMAQRICVWFCMKKGTSKADTFRELKEVFQNAAYSYRTVYRWYNQFESGRAKLGDLFCGSRKSKRTAETVNRCKQLVRQDRRSGIHKLSKQLGVGYGTVFTILHQDLSMKKRAAKFVPHALTDFDRQRRLDFAHSFLAQYAADPRCLRWVLSTDESWFYVHDPRSCFDNLTWMTSTENRPQIPRREMSTKKVMLIPFFDYRGLVHWEFFKGMTINKERFLGVLERLRAVLRVSRGSKVWHNREEYLLHMDNAPAHRSDLVQSYLRRNRWNTLTHPPYSPDLSPADFFLFPILKRKVRGHNFQNVENLVVAIDHELRQIPSIQWQRCFQDWIRHCRLCVLFDGNYFEGMIQPRLPEHPKNRRTQ